MGRKDNLSPPLPLSLLLSCDKYHVTHPLSAKLRHRDFQICFQIRYGSEDIWQRLGTLLHALTNYVRRILLASHWSSRGQGAAKPPTICRIPPHDKELFRPKWP